MNRKRLYDWCFNCTYLIGKRVRLIREFEGYQSGDTAVIDEFVYKQEGLFYRLCFDPIPGSLEEVRVEELSRIATVVIFPDFR